MFGRGLLEASPPGLVRLWHKADRGLVGGLAVRLVHGMDDDGGVGRVVDAHVDLHWKHGRGKPDQILIQGGGEMFKGAELRV